MVGKIACFLTCGYTEAGAMQQFLEKINDNFEYKQFLPNKTIKKKGMPKMINSHINGLTGESLLKKIYDIISYHKEELKQYKAMLIEDDLDGRFHQYSKGSIESFNEKIKIEVQSRLGKQIPVFFLYAAPEVESWFIADWKHGFKYLYTRDSLKKKMDSNICDFLFIIFGIILTNLF